MTCNQTEIDILNALRRCSFLPGSFAKKLAHGLDINNVSPLQRWWIYKFGYQYRKQIGNYYLLSICNSFLAANPMPMTRREAQKIVNKAMKTTISS